MKTSLARAIFASSPRMWIATVMMSLLAIAAFGHGAKAETVAITCPLNRYNADQVLQFVLDMSSSRVVHASNNGGSLVAPFEDIDTDVPFTMTARSISWDLLNEHWVFDRVTYELNDNFSGRCHVEERPL